MWTIYILECKNKSFYTGITTDLARRFQEHLNKKSRYTSYNPPVKIVYKEFQETRSQALKREFYIRKLPRKKKIALLSGQRIPKHTNNLLTNKETYI